MNEKWTPGPWRVSGVEVIIPDGPFNSCAYAGTKPNANLISAAPDLVDSIDPDTLEVTGRSEVVLVFVKAHCRNRRTRRTVSEPQRRTGRSGDRSRRR